MKKKIINIGFLSVLFILIILIGNKPIEKIGKDAYIHISFDDTIDIFQDLTNNKETYDSIFDNDTLDFLQVMHNRYGAVFSMFCFFENEDGSFNLGKCTNIYAEEFTANSSWLKFGFHNINGNGNLANASGRQAGTDYKKVINELKRITGSEKCIDNIVRLQNFAGGKEAINEMQKTTTGIRGLLTADDDRISYYLNVEDNDYIANNDWMWDSENKIYLVSTDLRLENIVFPYNNLQKIAKDDKQNKIIEVFTHEWLFSSKYNSFITKLKICATCIFAKDYGYKWTFPMNIWK